MHDLLLAKDILELAQAKAQGLELKKITKVVLKLGHIAEHHHGLGHEITPDNLIYNFNLLKKGTMADSAKLIIEHWRQSGWCLKNIYGTK